MCRHQQTTSEFDMGVQIKYSSIMVSNFCNLTNIFWYFQHIYWNFKFSNFPILNYRIFFFLNALFFLIIISFEQKYQGINHKDIFDITVEKFDPVQSGKCV